MISLKKRQSGFTIVELLIVIVIIGILATLVIVVFTGASQKARDSQRQTDISALDSHLEAYYAQNGFYPTLAALQDQGASGFVKTNMKGLDVEALKDPKGGNVAASASNTGNWAYGYATTGCTGTAITDSCTGFTLTANLESSSTPFTKSSNT